MFVYCVIGIQNIGTLTNSTIPIIYGVFMDIEEANTCKNNMSCVTDYLCSVQKMEVK